MLHSGRQPEPEIPSEKAKLSCFGFNFFSFFWVFKYNNILLNFNFSVFFFNFCILKNKKKNINYLEKSYSLISVEDKYDK